MKKKVIALALTACMVPVGSGVEDVYKRQVLENDAGGIGLFRSEFLYLGRNDFPTEEEQFQAYKQVVQTMAGKKVIIRTLDIDVYKRQPSYYNVCMQRAWRNDLGNDSRSVQSILEYKRNTVYSDAELCCYADRYVLHCVLGESQGLQYGGNY